MKFFSALFVLCSFTFIVFAQTTIPQHLVSHIDSSIEQNNLQEVKNTLTHNKNTTWGLDIESYVLRKARQLVVQDKMQQAKDLCLAVIDHNLDNLEAVNLYQSVNAAIQKQEKEQQKIAEADALETFKRQTEEAKTKQEAERKYATITNTSSGRKVYLDQNINTHYGTFSWDLLLGMVNINALFIPEGLNLLYGISLYNSLFYHGDVFTFGTDISIDTHVLTLYGTPSVNWSGTGIFSIANTNFNRHIFLRLGAHYVSYNTGQKEKETSFLTPVTGFGFNFFQIGQDGFLDFSIDWYPAHLYISEIDLALASQIRYTFTLAKLQDFDIFIRIVAFDTLILQDNRYKNDARVSLAFGVGNYD